MAFIAVAIIGGSVALAAGGAKLGMALSGRKKRIQEQEDAKEQMHQTQEAIVEMLSPTKFETSEDVIKNFDNEEDDEYISDEITEEIKIEDEDDDSFEL